MTMAQPVQEEKKTITITKDELETLISTSIKTALAVVQQPAPQTFQEAADSKKSGPPIDTKRFRVTSEATGAKFIAVSSRRSNGTYRVVNIEDYKHPEDIDAQAAARSIKKQSEEGKIYDQYKQWVYTNYWLRDLQHYVGQPLPARLATDLVVDES
jgi:hypothetical protein